MRDKSFKIQACFILLGWILICSISLAHAKDGKLLRTQGLINPGGNPKAGYLIINEMRVYIDKATQLMNDRETPISITELTPKRWVYMEIVKASEGKVIKAKRIYLLPHYVSPDERRKFSFMK